MNVTAVKDIPNVDQSSIWKGYYEAHFLSGKEILEKYPTQNTIWNYSYDIFPTRTTTTISYDGYYYVYEKDIDTVIISDPWFRQFKNHTPFEEVDIWSGKANLYHTTVEGNSVLLVVYKK
jgi:hypothetical protein